MHWYLLNIDISIISHLNVFMVQLDVVIKTHGILFYFLIIYILLSIYTKLYSIAILVVIYCVQHYFMIHKILHQKHIVHNYAKNGTKVNLKEYN